MPDIQIYTKEWCPYCAKAKALLKAKGLAYREVDVTTDQAAEQEMIARSGLRTVPQIFLDGESLGGYDALASSNASGDLDRRLGLPAVEYRRVYDLAVVGAGPAGLSAALYAVRKNLATVLVSLDVGGQVGTTHEVANYPGLAPVTGPDLIQQMYAQVQEFAIDMVVGERVRAVKTMPGILLLETESAKEICAKCVVVASGAEKRHLGIPGEKQLAGRGVVYCSTCDGPLFRGRRIAVIGGGNAGLETLIEMQGVASEVTLVSRGELAGDQVLVDKALGSKATILTRHEPVAIQGTDRVTGLVVKNLTNDTLRTLEVDGVFVEVGFRPHTDFVLDLLETNNAGEIKVDAQGRTSVPGVFAAGDAIDIRYKQIVMAAGQGARAALAAFEYLLQRT